MQAGIHTEKHPYETSGYQGKGEIPERIDRGKERRLPSGTSNSEYLLTSHEQHWMLEDDGTMLQNPEGKTFSSEQPRFSQTTS